MPKIGNDIVDLNLAKTESNWQRPGFLEKQLPEYMIPEYFHCIESFPLSANGKIDRNLLSEQLKDFFKSDS